jgi:hypothetical protein
MVQQTRLYQVQTDCGTVIRRVASVVPALISVWRSSMPQLRSELLSGLRANIAVQTDLVGRFQDFDYRRKGFTFEAFRQAVTVSDVELHRLSRVRLDSRLLTQAFVFMTYHSLAVCPVSVALLPSVRGSLNCRSSSWCP